MGEDQVGNGVIKVNNISKIYKLFDREKDRLKEALSFSRKQYHRDFHALHDLTMEIGKGEIVGIIGQNGSGKSTLLKIIAGVLTPTSGTVSVSGTMASLLELGAGFNPELNGIDNVYMNGYIMGFTKEEMDRKIAGILDFADIGDFVYQPVKAYSSGMFVRLAFASAISTDPDILIVDEALSVGDIAFQNKCFAKFDALKRSGTTILFVTHSLELITRHCQRALFMEQGRMVADGAVNDIVNLYTQSLTQSGKMELVTRKSAAEEVRFAKGPLGRELIELDSEFFSNQTEDVFSRHGTYNPGEFRWGDQRASIIDYCLEVGGGQVNPTYILSNSLVTVYIKCLFHEQVDRVIFGLLLKTIDGVVVSGFNTSMARIDLAPRQANEICILKYSFKLNVTAGKYSLSVGISEEELNGEAKAVDRRNDAILFEVTSEYPFTGIVDLNVNFQLLD
ncbi:ABC transporter ATP-binding protein [Cohnella sp. LGH]|uniref:ABC transporter ATP-binding protein n=1 Tax=Cohnella sp. LGH TaxID=1619153 RepID=UPI001AD97DDB|nr:ABC transporter ATP-binding protein [Cohnella sp. LGH]QTH42335.1 ABC transporter ATP-binding protein [Cohnella sp. LGH]